MALGILVLEGAVAAVALYTLYGALYRLYLAPVAKFPGPKLTALTFWYEFYYDVIKCGSYVYRIKEMHEEYGPIVRINPYELHVIDTDLNFINQLYPSVGKEVDKFWWSAGMFGNVEMTFGTIPHALHRTRRAAFGKFFSTAYIRRLEPTLQGLVNSMVEKIETGVEAGKKVNLVHAFSALTQDVITEYCFAECRNVLEMEDFAPHYYVWMQIHCTLTPVIKQFPWLIPTLNYLPDWWVKLTNPAAWLLRLQTYDYTAQTQRVLTGGEGDRTSHATIFHALRDDPDLPPEEKSRARLVAEAGSIVGAGTLTSTHMLSLTTYMVLNDNMVLRRLLAELETAIPDPSSSASLQTLEPLRYLNAVIDEGLRLSYGSMHRLTRFQPKNTLSFKDWVIPPNTPVGMTPRFLHENESIFPNYREFDPQRWLDAEPKDRELMQKYISNFGKGSRQCVGMKLAYAEIYLALGYLFRRLGGADSAI
ncbi:hypothetical protein MMC30_009411 [Trapelia coarctata]|nr:hypothetical protein [Trapelia coarctata]